MTRHLLLLAAFAGLILCPVEGQTQESGTARSATEAAPERGERGMRLEERYRAMLATNPTEGMALDRLWKAHEEDGTTANLLESYGKAAEAVDAPSSSMLVYGHLLKRTGKPDEAAAWYERAAAKDPGSPLPPMARADLLSQRGAAEQAAGFYGQAVSLLPVNDRRRTDLLLKQGTALLAAGKPGEAAECWEKIVAASPNDLNVRKQLADAYEKNGFPERATVQQEFIAAHASPPERAAAWRELGRLREVRGDFDGAAAALESGLALTARDNWLHGDLQTRLIRLYQRAGRTDELAAKWRAAAGAAPRDLGGYLRLEALAEAQGDAAARREFLEKIVALSPRDRENVRKLAVSLVEAGEPQKAADLYDGLLKTQPGNLELILARADLEVQTGHPAAAARRVEERADQAAADGGVQTAALNFFLAHHLMEAAERLLRAEVLRQPMVAEPSLALAKFLFSERRGKEAATVLETLAAQGGDAAIRAGRLAAIAEAYKAGNHPDEALRCWEQVAILRPDDPAPLVAAAELRRTRGEVAVAVPLLEQAAALSPAGEARQGMEKKLFDLLRGEDRGETADATSGLDPGPRQRINRPARGSLLEKYLSGLAAQARTGKTAEGHLRLARWEAWAHEDDKALAACRAALALDPDNAPARLLAADIAAESRQTDLAEQMLTEVLQRDPASEGTILRQFARLKLQAGDNEGALNLFTRLQTLAPGSRAALSDLAQAQQRLDRWFDAKLTWEQAYALPGGTPAQRGEVRRSLLAACEHLGQFDRAVQILSESVDEQPDEAGKEDVFRQLSELAGKHGMEEPVRRRLTERLERRPDDYFTLVALAQLSRDGGRPEEGYQLLRRAQFSSPDPARSLRGLVQEAETLGKLADAEMDQSRLLAMPGQWTADNLQKLADLQAANLDADEAASTWNKAVARFPRDPVLLAKAADYFESADQPTRARELQAQAAALEPANFGLLLRLAALDMKSGNLPSALASYEQVLLRTEPEGPGEPLAPPDELTLRPEPASSLIIMGGKVSRSRVVAPVSPADLPAAPKASNPDRAIRLQAITEAARLLAESRQSVDAAIEKLRGEWTARWQAAAGTGQRNEPLAALYFSGQKEATMGLLSRWLAAPGGADPMVPGVFLCAGMQLGDYEGLARWAWADDRSSEKLDRPSRLASAVIQFLGTGGKPKPGCIAMLFPAGANRQDLFWETAQRLATMHWYGLAGELGGRALALQTGRRSTVALQVADWQLTSGDSQAARDTLRLTLDEGGGWSFDVNTSPIFSVLRAYYVLLPEAARPGFVTDYLASRGGKGEKTHALLASALLHGLSGEEAAARRDLDAFLRRRMVAGDEDGPSPDERRWSYLLTNGVQLQTWNLDRLAAYLWEQALKEATAFDDKIGEEGSAVLEIRRRLLAVEVATADDPEQAREIVAGYLGTRPPTGTAVSIVGELMNDAHYEGAEQIAEYLCRVEPGNAEHWRRLISVYDAERDSDRLEGALAKLFEGERPAPEGLPRPEFVSRWAAARERNGDPAGARLILERERADNPGDLALLVLLAQICERSNRLDQAADLWREMLALVPTNLPVLNLATIEEKRGEPEEAVRLLEGALTRSKEGGSAEVAERLARLYLAAGKADQIRALAESLLRDGKTDALPAVASALATAGQKAAAVELLNAAVARTRDPLARFRLQQGILPLVTPYKEDPRPFLRALARLETFAHDVPGLRSNWEATRYKLVREAGADAWLERDLRRRWDGGKADYAAGERLVALYLDTHQDEGLRRTVEEFDRRPRLPDQLLYGIEKMLLDGDKAALALPISERLANRFPQNANFTAGRITTLWKSDQRETAGRMGDALIDGANLRDNGNEQLGLLQLSLGDKARARASFERAVRADPLAARSPNCFLQLARLEMEAGHLEEAQKLLLTVYRQDTSDDFAPLVALLSARGDLDGERASNMPAQDFLLSFRRRGALLSAVHDELNRRGRGTAARRLLRRHAAFLAELPGTAAALVQESPVEELPQLAKCLGQAVAQIEPPLPRLLRLASALPQPPGSDPAASPSASAATAR